MRVNGFIDSGGMCGSSSWLSEIVEGAFPLAVTSPCTCMHYSGGPPMTPGSLAAGGFFAGSLITPSVLAPLVLTGMQCGLLSSLAFNSSKVTVHLQ